LVTSEYPGRQPGLRASDSRSRRLERLDVSSSNFPRTVYDLVVCDVRMRAAAGHRGLGL